MKTLLLRSILLLTLAGLAQPRPAWGQTDRPAANDRLDRIERLERRIDEIAQRQEQFMRRAELRMQNREPAQPPVGRQLGSLPPRPNPEMGAAARSGLSLHQKKLHDLLGLLCLIGLICNILLAVWIYTDIRKRNEGSGIFVAMALIAGIPAALIYALTRIGDKKA